MLVYFILLLLSGCSKSSSPKPPVVPIETLPKAVTKAVTKKVFVHMMPWFETSSTNGGNWGIHWTMNTKNPNNLDANGQRQIASHYYPLTGPYASGDTLIIDYQLLLMKLSGIDGVYIDWPGTQAIYDYPLLVANTKKIVSRLSKVGLNYAIVYEDQNLSHAGDKLATAQADMTYLQNNFFGNTNYEKIDGRPVLLVFGPQQVQTASVWTQIFSVLPVAPAFFTLLYESGDAGSNALGEFSWVSQNNLITLNDFYGRSFAGQRMGSA